MLVLPAGAQNGLSEPRKTQPSHRATSRNRFPDKMARMRVRFGLVCLLLCWLSAFVRVTEAAPRRPPRNPPPPPAAAPAAAPATTAAPASPAASQPTAAPVAPSQTALKILSGVEGAELVLDGEVLGMTPFKEPIPVAPGEHTIRVSRLGFTPHIDVIKVKPGQVMKIEVELTPIAGVLGVTANSVKDGPAVRVFVDDKFFGKAPIETEVTLGSHQIRVERPGYYSETFTINAEPGKRIDKDVDLKPLPPDQNPYLVKPVQVKWYQKWWVWTVVAVGVAVVATAIIVPVVLSRRTICNDNVDICPTIQAAPLLQLSTPPQKDLRFVQPLFVAPQAQPQLVPSLTLRTF